MDTLTYEECMLRSDQFYQLALAEQDDNKRTELFELSDNWIVEADKCIKRHSKRAKYGKRINIF